MEISIVVLSFVMSMVVSGVVIYIATKLLGEKEGFGTAILAALVGGIAWLIVLGSLYKIGWLKSLLIAAVVWVIISLLSFLPTLVGPL